MQGRYLYTHHKNRYAMLYSKLKYIMSLYRDIHTDKQTYIESERRTSPCKRRGKYPSLTFYIIGCYRSMAQKWDDDSTSCEMTSCP